MRSATARMLKIEESVEAQIVLAQKLAAWEARERDRLLPELEVEELVFEEVVMFGVENEGDGR